jgi:16S rRNA G966 N2-methylase RsmD
MDKHLLTITGASPVVVEVVKRVELGGMTLLTYREPGGWPTRTVRLRAGEFEMSPAPPPPAHPPASVRELLDGAVQSRVRIAPNQLHAAYASERGGGSLANGDFSASEADDALEVAVNAVIVEGVLDGPTLEALRPTRTRRSQDMQRLQQFSTPHYLAEVMTFCGVIKPGMSVLEPSAGTGNLVAQSLMRGAALVIGVEKSASRRNKLAYLATRVRPGQEVRVLAGDAGHLGVLEIPPVDRVLMNPPFTYAHKHTIEAARCLKPGGRLVALLPHGMRYGGAKCAPLLKELARFGTVRALVSLPGDEYAGNGTTYPNAVLVLDAVQFTGVTPLFGEAASWRKAKEMLLSAGVTEVFDVADTGENAKPLDAQGDLVAKSPIDDAPAKPNSAGSAGDDTGNKGMAAYQVPAWCESHPQHPCALVEAELMAAGGVVEVDYRPAWIE